MLVGELAVITEQQAIRIAHDDAIINYHGDLDVKWNTGNPLRGFDAGTNEWTVHFKLKIPSRGGSAFYRIDGVTGAIRERRLSR